MRIAKPAATGSLMIAAFLLAVQPGAAQKSGSGAGGGGVHSGGGGARGGSGGFPTTSGGGAYFGGYNSANGLNGIYGGYFPQDVAANYFLYGVNGYFPLGVSNSGYNGDPAMAQRMVRKRNIERFEHEVGDTQKLVRLSKELQDKVSNLQSDVLPKDLLKETAEIEKLARGIREKEQGSN